MANSIPLAADNEAFALYQAGDLDPAFVRNGTGGFTYQGTDALNLVNQKIILLADPTDAKDVANKEYVDNLPQAFAKNPDGRYQFTQTDFMSMNNQQIASVKDPTSPQDAATKKYTDDAVSGAVTQANAYFDTNNMITKESNGSGTYKGTGPLSMSNQPVVLGTAPTNNTDATNKFYVDQQDEINLQLAQGYANTQAAGALDSAKSYTDSENLWKNDSGEIVLKAPLQVNLKGYGLKEVGSPAAGTDAANKNYVDGKSGWLLDVYTWDDTNSRFAGNPIESPSECLLIEANGGHAFSTGFVMYLANAGSAVTLPAFHFKDPDSGSAEQSYYYKYGSPLGTIKPFIVVGTLPVFNSSSALRIYHRPLSLTAVTTMK